MTARTVRVALFVTLLLAGLDISASQAAGQRRFIVPKGDAAQPAKRVKATASATPTPPVPVDLPLSTPATSLAFSTGDPTPQGYIPIPHATMALRVAGILKLDAIHDAEFHVGDASDPRNMALPVQEVTEPSPALARLQARESRFSLAMYRPTAVGPLLALLETDFYGAGGPNAHGVRVRHAYVTWRHILAGLTFSNFLDPKARGTTVKLNAATPAGTRRRAQIRVSYPLGERATLAAAVENATADFTDWTGTKIGAAKYAFDSNVVRQLPDLTGQLGYIASVGHLSLRGVARQLRAAAAGGSGRMLTVYGYGGALSGQWQPYGRSTLFAQVIGGVGIGGYLDDLDGQAATFDHTGTLFAPQLGYAAMAGEDLYLNEYFRSNMIASVCGVRLPELGPRGPDVRPLFRRSIQLLANLIYTPVPDVTVGIEYGYLRQETSTSLVSFGQRLQLGVALRFGR
jgi:hypothetical protein